MTKNRIATMVEKGMYTRVARGVVALGTPRQDIWAKAMRGAMVAGSKAVVALWTAARLHDLDAPRDHTIHVVVPGSQQRQPTSELYVHRTRYLPREHITTLRNVPMTSLARTIVDCARLLGVSPALRMLDSCSASARTWQEIHRTAERLSQRSSGSARNRGCQADRRVGWLGPPQRSLGRTTGPRDRPASIAGEMACAALHVERRDGPAALLRQPDPRRAPRRLIMTPMSGWSYERLEYRPNPDHPDVRAERWTRNVWVVSVRLGRLGR